MNKRRLSAVLASSAVLSLGLSLGPVANASAASIRDGGVLHAVSAWGTIVHNFNPLTWDGGTGTTTPGTLSALYEPLIYQNQYTGKQTPLLATGYKWEDKALKLVLTTRRGVTWTDGKAFSAADVAFTFNLLKKYPALDAEGVWKTPLTSVVATNSDTVVFTFSSAYTPAFTSIVLQPIVPEHIWATIANPVKFINPDPVGTGPFTLKKYTPVQVTYARNPHYWWAGRPYINGITMTSVENNTVGELLVLNGDAAFTNDAITDVSQSFVAKNPAENHYWWPGYQLNLLYFNTATAPFDNLALRKAVAEALNPTEISDRAYFGALPAGNETAVTAGQVSEWVPSSLSSLEWPSSTSAALATLNAAGYKVVSGQLEAPGGTPVPPQNILIGGPGWTDYISIAQTISQELQAIGISSTVQQETFATYYSDLQEGSYTLAVSWNNNNYGTPYYAYYDLLDSSESAPVGSSANTDWERFTSPAIDSALTNYASTTNLATQKADIVTVEKSVLQNVPVVALTARPNWFDYSTKYFTGWPSASDPYNEADPPDYYGGGAELMYLNVHLK
jgi:peptide/nickel transport system substrate-binding protein